MHSSFHEWNGTWRFVGFMLLAYLENKSLGFMHLWRARDLGLRIFWHLCELSGFVRAAFCCYGCLYLENSVTKISVMHDYCSWCIRSVCNAVAIRFWWTLQEWMKRCGMQLHMSLPPTFLVEMPQDITVNPWGYSLKIESTYKLLRLKGLKFDICSVSWVPCPLFLLLVVHPVLDERNLRGDFYRVEFQWLCGDRQLCASWSTSRH